MSSRRRKKERRVAPEDNGGAPPEEAPDEEAPSPDPAPDPEQTPEHWRELYLRASADLHNLRKRSGQEIEERTVARLEALLGDLIRVDDFLAAALDHVPQEVREADPGGAFLSGMQAIRGALEGTLRAHGLELLEPGPDTDFDPREHEAVEVVEEPELERPRLELVKRGFRIGRRILRPAQVRLRRPAAPDREDAEGDAERGVDPPSGA